MNSKTTDPYIEQILYLLTENVAMSESLLSKKTGIKIKELRLLLGKLRDEGRIEHNGTMVWLSNQEDEFGRLDWSKIPELEHLVGSYYTQRKNAKK